MARPTEVRVDGLKELQSDFKKLTRSFDPGQVEVAAVESAEIIASQARKNAPVRSGTLRDAIKAKPLNKDKDNISAIAAVDRAEAYYAGWVEYGTSRMAAIPYFRPAVESKGNQAANHFRKKLKQIVEGAVN